MYYYALIIILCLLHKFKLHYKSQIPKEALGDEETIAHYIPIPTYMVF